MAKKKKAERRNAMKVKSTKKKTIKKKVSPRKKKKVVKRKKARTISSVVRVREVTVRYGGVIKTGSYENRRVSYEMTAEFPKSVSPNDAFDYLEAIAANQFYQAQLEAIEGLPTEMQDEIGDIRKMSPQEAAQRIGDFFANYRKQMKFTPEQKKQLIKSLDDELKKVMLGIKDENKRIKKLKKTKPEDFEKRARLTQRKQEIRKELKELRSKK